MSLFGSACVLANSVKRAPVEWSVEQCGSVYLLATYDLDGAPLECAKISYVSLHLAPDYPLLNRLL
jgi:hypothetical protein